MSKALIAMSGGVDSAVAAKRMLDAGYTCAAVTMKLFSPANGEVLPDNSCCSAKDVEDAKRVAAELGIPHTVCDFSDKFDSAVIAPFVDDYENGRTPNPCIACNRHLKFDALFAYAMGAGFDTIVTGHYARIEQDANTGRYLLKRAVYAEKDQSYVLYTLSQNQLAHTQFPLGALPKTDVRAEAAASGLINADKPDSQDICFVQNGKYTDFIRAYTGKAYPAGDFVDMQGNTLGTHRGIIHYTVGQRKGLGIAAATPLYVAAVNVADNTVVLGQERDLYTTTLTAKHINLISTPTLDAPLRVQAKVRYRQAAQDATAVQTDADTLTVTFDTPQRAVTKGQSVVLYDGDTVVGGGIIV